MEPEGWLLVGLGIFVYGWVAVWMARREDKELKELRRKIALRRIEKKYKATKEEE